MIALSITPMARERAYKLSGEGSGVILLNRRLRGGKAASPWGEIDVRFDPAIRVGRDGLHGYNVRADGEDCGRIILEPTGAQVFIVIHDQGGPRLLFRPAEDSVLPGEVIGEDHRFCSYQLVSTDGSHLGSATRVGCRIDSPTGGEFRGVSHRLHLSRSEATDGAMLTAALLVMASETGDIREHLEIAR